MKKVSALVLMTMIFILFAACSPTDDSKDSEEECTPVLQTGEAANGDYCERGQECQSGFCLAYAHTPADPDGACADAVPEGEVHVTANIRDFLTQELIPNQLVEYAGAVDVSQNPLGFKAKAEDTSDDDGIIDTILTGDAASVPTGILAVAQKDGYYKSATGLAEPEMGCGVYAPGIRNRDFKLVSETMLSDWSALLEADFPELADRLPLGENGGVVGRIRWVDDGAGVENVTVESQNESSGALIYYLDEDENGFNQDKTASSGLFVVFNPGLAEKFDSVLDGQIISRKESTMGSAAGIIFNTTVHADIQYRP